MDEIFSIVSLTITITIIVIIAVVTDDILSTRYTFHASRGLIPRYVLAYS